LLLTLKLIFIYEDNKIKNKTIINNESEKNSFIEKMLAATITKPILIETSSYKPKRSSAINSLMWIGNAEIQKHIRETQGQIYSTDDIHEYFVNLLLPRAVIEINGRERAIRAHTSKFNNKQMVEYLELLEMYCSEHLSLILTHPDEYREAMKC